MKAVISVIGKDRTGIIARVATTVADVNVNILDISQTTMQGVFTMIMLVDIIECTIPFDELNKRLEVAGVELGLQIQLQHEDIFNAMHKLEFA